MPRKKKKDEVKREIEPIDEAAELRKLVYKTRDAKNKIESNIAFEIIVEKLDVKIKRMANRYKIPGCTFEDVYQECLIALRYKAIKDYDETKKNKGETGPALFERFAMMCIRRHLATAWKTANQNKKRILNNYTSLNQDRSKSNEDLSLSDIISDDSPPLLDRMEMREFIINFVQKIASKLSDFERQVFLNYIKKHSYEKIAEIILMNSNDKSVKAIDNALSRIKNKGEEIAQRMILLGNTPQAALYILKKHFGDDLVVPEEE